MKKQLLLTAIIIIISRACLIAQPGQIAFTPPNVSAIIKNDKVPVNLFTGAADIKIPLYNLKVDNYQIPIYMSYNTRGVQPNTHAGWVGTGWTLYSEPVINRKINGMIDECIQLPSGGGLAVAGFNGQIGWYYTPVHSLLYNNTGWIEQANLSKYIGDGLYDGSGLHGTQGANALDSAPDEFSFSVNGFSGTFFMGEDGLWKVRTTSGTNVSIEVEAPGPITLDAFPGTNKQFQINPTFRKFKLTTDDGTVYTFGEDPNSIDFNRMGKSNVYGNTNVVSVAWHLTKVELPSNKIITYQYIRQGVVFNYTPFSSAKRYSLDASSTNAPWYDLWLKASASGTTTTTTDRDVNFSVMDPVYLKSITFPSGKLEFNSTASNEEDKKEGWFNGYNFFAQPTEFPPKTVAGSAYSLINSYEDLRIPNSVEPHNGNWRKLDDIILYNNDNLKLKDFKFDYSPQSTTSTRLFLRKITELGFDESMVTQSLPPYEFYYNSVDLPAYCSFNTDHWGYFNGTTPFPEVIYDPDHFPSAAFEPIYNNFRNPNENYTKAGILTSIKYPTGGFTSFEYEPNKYKAWVGNFPPQVVQLSQGQELVGGGLRIKKILSLDKDSLQKLAYNYYYVNNLSSNISSGILGMPMPKYFRRQELLRYSYSNLSTRDISNVVSTVYSLWSSNLILPSQNDDGNIVTYSSVIEQQSGNGTNNGYKLSVFSNHDNGNGSDPNGYLNNPADASIAISPDEAELFHYNDRGFERGMLLSETIFNASNNPIKKVENKYNDDPNRFNSFVKGIYSTNHIEKTTFNSSNATINVQMNFIRNSAVRFYTYYPFLKQTTETNYGLDNTKPPVITITDYIYDSVNGTKNVTKKSFNNSKGEKVIDNMSYALDFGINGTDAFTLGIKNLRLKKAIGLPIEQYSQTSNIDGTNLRTINAQLNSYNSTYPYADLVYRANLVSPKSNFIKATNSSGLLLDPSYENEQLVDQYDNFGNVLQLHKDKAPKESYIWGYNNNYPIANVKNSLYKNIFYEGFELGSGNSTLNDSKTGKFSYNGSYSKSLSNLDPGQYTLSYSKKLSTGWTMTTLTVDVIGSTYLISLSGQIDDIRFYPKDAFMTTYTYDPQIGMTSSTDAKGLVTSFKYDSFQRLQNIKDDKNNIIKNYKYNYVPVMIGNTIQSRLVNKQCDPGYSGSAVPVTVAANTYFAYDQASANQAAINYLNTNGQITANSTGSCSISDVNNWSIIYGISDPNDHTVRITVTRPVADINLVMQIHYRIDMISGSDLIGAFTMPSGVTTFSYDATFSVPVTGNVVGISFDSY